MQLALRIPDTTAGTHIAEAAAEAVDVAQQFRDCAGVVFTFNGIDMFVRPEDTTATVRARYDELRGSDELRGGEDGSTCGECGWAGKHAKSCSRRDK